jgi:poly-gamma-glutamate synthesis protein (capsule biosynthesis protein)
MTGILLALLLSADGGTAKTADAGAAPLGPHPRATVLFGGDVIPHSPLRDAIRAQAKKDPEQMAALWAEALAGLKPAFAAADFAMVNLETPIVTSKKPFSGQWIFTSTPDLLEGLKRVGVKGVWFANNHARDQQLDGIPSTRKYLDEAGLKSVGAAGDAKSAWEPLVVEINGIKIGFFAFTRFLNQFQNRKDPKIPHVPFVPYAGEARDGGATVEELLKRIKEMRASVDALVVLPHWGTEYFLSPKDQDQALAEQLLTAGVTAVVGTHPHVIQPVLWRRMGPNDDRVVAFSIGNLLSNQEPDKWTDDSRFGLLLELTFERVNGVVSVVSGKPTPIWTDNMPAAGGRKISVMTLKDAIDTYKKQSVDPALTPGKQKMVLRRAEIMERKNIFLEKQIRPDGPQR